MKQRKKLSAKFLAAARMNQRKAVAAKMAKNGPKTEHLTPAAPTELDLHRFYKRVIERLL